MKITAAILSILATCTAASASQYTETFVQIDVDCEGLDLHSFSTEDGEISSKALQDSYNEVHAETDNGDKTLSDVHFYPFSQGLRGDSWLQQGGCSQGTHCGSGGCENCPPDDDSAYILFSSVSSAALKKWQVLYAKKLRAQSNQVFRAVGSCKLNMHPVETTLEVEKN